LDDDQWGETPFHDIGVVWERALDLDEIKPGTNEGGQSINLKLECISIAKSGVFAVINGKTLAPGETIAGHTVRSISLDQVVLEKDDSTTVLRLWDDDE
jgi:hypothetical protein